MSVAQLFEALSWAQVPAAIVSAWTTACMLFPRVVISLIGLLWPPGPHRTEQLSTLPSVPMRERPLVALGSLEAGLLEGLPLRARGAVSRATLGGLEFSSGDLSSDDIDREAKATQDDSAALAGALMAVFCLCLSISISGWTLGIPVAVVATTIAAPSQTVALSTSISWLARYPWRRASRAREARDLVLSRLMRTLE